MSLSEAERRADRVAELIHELDRLGYPTRELETVSEPVLELFVAMAREIRDLHRLPVLELFVAMAREIRDLHRLKSLETEVAKMHDDLIERGVLLEDRP